MTQGKSSTMFKKGELDFKKILFLQIDRTMRCLTEGSYIGFIDGVEGIYLLLISTAEKDTIFTNEDKKLEQFMDKEKPGIEDDIMLWSQDKEMMLSSLGLQCAKRRLASLIKLAGRHRLLLEQRRIVDERTEESRELTDDEIRAIVEDSSDEEKNSDSAPQNQED